MIAAFFQGRIDEARKLHYQYLPLFKGLFIAPNPTCLKYAMSRLGLCKAHLRLPLAPLGSEQQKAIDKLIKELNIGVTTPTA
jgi:4-hydroxy-tetrahydrodipicolinate synthase